MLWTKFISEVNMLIREDEILKGIEKGKTLKEIYEEKNKEFIEAIKEQNKQ